MSSKLKYQLEYIIKSSPKVLYNRLSTAAGLSEWFADDVFVKGDIFTFIWNKSKEQAMMINKKDQKYVRFQWLDVEKSKTFFEFRINVLDLTGEVALIITDFANDEEDKKESMELWDSQVGNLKQLLGT